MLTPGEVAYRDQERRRTTEAIRRWGCLVMHVSDDVDCACCAATGTTRAERRARKPARRRSTRWKPAFSYTIGLHGIGHPELLVFGLDLEPARALLTRLTHEVRDHGRDLVPGEVISGSVGDGRSLLVESLPNPADILVQANNYYRRPDKGSVEALQLSWPDPMGRWPGEPGCLVPASQQPRPGTFRA